MTAKMTANLLKQKDKVLIITHKKPDGDTTGCASSLCQALRLIGKEVYILFNPEITDRYEYLIKPYYAPAEYKPEFTVLVDMADERLRTENATIYNTDLCIDHHQSNTFFAENTCMLPMGACGEVIYEIITNLGVELNQKMAEAVYIAIATDTGCFRYSNTTKNTHMVAMKCYETGFDVAEINKKLFETKSYERISLEKFVYDNIMFFDDKKIALIYLSIADMAKLNAKSDDIDSISALPRQIEGVDIGFTLIEKENGEIKVSIRTTTKISANEIAAKFGGGGHIRASGVTLKMSKDEAIEKLIKVAVGLANV